MSEFFKDPGDLESLNLSDISDVDPDEIEKIVKSAGELDKKYLGFGSTNKDSLEAKDRKLSSSSKPEDTINQLSFLGDNEDAKLKGGVSTSGKASLPVSTESPLGTAIKPDLENVLKTQKKSRGSADWLGLKDSPVKQPSFDADDYMRSKTNPLTAKTEVPLPEPLGRNALSPRKTPVTPSSTFTNLLSSVERKASPERGLYTPPLPGDSPLTMSLKHKSAQQVNRNKGKLIDELFGEAKRAGEDSFRIGVDSEQTKKDEQIKDSYTPSASAGRRLERRGGTAPKPSSGVDDDFDWLLGTKSSSKTKTVGNEPNMPSNPSETTAPAPVKTSTPRTAIKETKMPDWLEGIIPDSTQKEDIPVPVSSEPRVASQSKKLPEWLGGSNNPPDVLQSNDTNQPSNTEPPINNLETSQPNPLNPPVISKIQFFDDAHNNIAVKLASIQKELGDAIAKRNENLQIYMQVLIQEAQRVVSIPNISVDIKRDHHNEEDKKDGDDDLHDHESRIDKKDETIKHQEDLIHDFEINVSRLELQNTQLEMKIENLKSTHEMEIEMLKKNHGFEIAAWETRLERMKTTFDETISDYKNKIAKLKENEEILITEHKERIKKLEEERLSDLEKLGEFHRIAIEQAATLTVPVPNMGHSLLRLPLKALNRPKDEVELSERESALLEKERQLEVLKAAVEAEKRELDEALEVEKFRREERDRESRRQATEARLREEARQSEAKREREQLDALSLQIKLMREDALKEQGEIAKEKLELAAERARLEAVYSIQGRSDASIPPLDIMQARAEVEAALEAARQAKEAAEQERRKQAELRQAVDQITWEQKEMDLRLENRKKHLSSMLSNAEKLRNEGLAALDEAKAMKEELHMQQKDIKEQIKQIETKEKVLAKERLEIAKEKIELERRRAQLQIILPELNPDEELTLNPPKVYVDPKAVIMRLKAEKELESFITTQQL